MAAHANRIAGELAQDKGIPLNVIPKPVLTTPDAITQVCTEANASGECVGIIAWMHTFSQAKIWLSGLASLHLDASVPNFLIQECCGQAVPHVRDTVWEEWFGFPAMRMVNGKYPLPEKPGLGVDLSEDALKKYPFAGSRPMARVFHKDGSVPEW